MSVSLASSRFSAWLSSFSGPVVCFGPRALPSCLLARAWSCGRLLASSGRAVWSGGAAGADSAFVGGARSVGGAFRVFRPAPGSGVPGLFARSVRALRGALAAGGGAVVFVPVGARGGGSRFSARVAWSLGLPVCLVFFRPSGAVARVVFRGRSAGPRPLRGAAGAAGQKPTELERRFKLASIEMGFPQKTEVPMPLSMQTFSIPEFDQQWPKNPNSILGSQPLPTLERNGYFRKPDDLGYIN